MLISFYILDGTEQCSDKVPNDPAIGREKLEECGLTVLGHSRHKHSGFIAAKCGLPTNWCWVYQTDAPTRQSVRQAELAGFKIWSYDEEGLNHLVSILNGSDTWPFAKILQRMGGDFWPMKTERRLQDIAANVKGFPINDVIQKFGGVDVWPMLVAQGGGEAWPMAKKMAADDDALSAFDTPAIATSSIQLSDCVGKTLRVLEENDLHDASYDPERVNIRVNNNRRIIAIWIG